MSVKCVFIVKRSGHHRVPLSSPTRRSSDPEHAGKPAIGAEERGAGIGGAVPALVAVAVGEDADAIVLLEGVVEDRKSTRLNSSHANISYAVFCLKKKKPVHHISVYHWCI